MYPVFSCIYWVIFADLEGIEQQSLEGARMGFTGKQVIHPSHVPIVQRAFSPTQEQVTWASQLVEAFTAHSQSGKGRERDVKMILLLHVYTNIYNYSTFEK